MTLAERGVQWLRRELREDANDWRERGVVTSILFAVVDAWLWLGSGLRLLVYITLAALYLPEDTTVGDIASVEYSAAPSVIEPIPGRVDGNLRTATCVLGLAGIATVGVWPSLSFGTPASRLWIASQLWFLALDPVWGVWHRVWTTDSTGEVASAWRPLTASGED